jgi:hypothetical protein
MALAACAVYAFVAAAVAMAFPREGLGFVASFGWWLCAIPVGLGVYIAVESFGTWGLDRPLWQRMSSSARILLLVILVGCLAIGAVFVSQLVNHHGWL